MITRVVSTGLLAGLVSGLCIAVLQAFTTTPIILAAEVYEHGSHAHAQAGLQKASFVLVHSAHDADEGDADEWAPADGWERTLFTSTATVGTAIGFALILLAGMLISRDPIDQRRGMAWGVAGFAAAGLAPAVGLSPEVPGMMAADLVSRQGWWIATAIATATAIWLFVRSDNIWLRLLSVPILLAPYVWGAPQLDGIHQSNVPAHLAAQFAATALAVQAVLWALTGLLVGTFWTRVGGSHGNQLG